MRVDLLSGKGYYIGTDTTVLNDGETLSINPYATDPTNPLYTIDANTLGTINVNTGAFTAKPNAAGTCSDGTNSYTITDMDGLALRYGSADPGEWYAAVRLDDGSTTGRDDLLVRLDPVTGLVVPNAFGTGISCVSIHRPSGNTNLRDIDDLAFTPNGILYGIANANVVADTHIVVIDYSATASAGSTIDLGAIEYSPGTYLEDVEGFSIDKTGAAWAHTGSQITTHDTMWRIDLNSSPIVARAIGTYSAAGTLIPQAGSTGYNATYSYSDYEGLACYGAASAGKRNTLSSIGNYVWLDEDGDGYQDAGEAGIANVRVDLWSPGVDGVFGTGDDQNLKTTFTDIEGGYVFKELTAANYQVRIPATNFGTGAALEGMTQTTNPVNAGADFGNQTLAVHDRAALRGENLTADFGYNYVARRTRQQQHRHRRHRRPGLGPTRRRRQAGSRRDRACAGVTVDSWYDSDGDGDFDPLYHTNGTATTNATGNYVFDELPAGIYEVRVTGSTDS